MLKWRQTRPRPNWVNSFYREQKAALAQATALSADTTEAKPDARSTSMYPRDAPDHNYSGIAQREPYVFLPTGITYSGASLAAIPTIIFTSWS